MIITGISLTDFENIVSNVSHSVYAGNIIVNSNVREYSGNRFSARIRAIDSGTGTLPPGESALGSRRTSGSTARRSVSACWHAYRDVIAAVFEANPKARVRTSMESYIGVEGFRKNYPSTGWCNIGSEWYPRYMPDLCDCPREIRNRDR